MFKVQYVRIGHLSNSYAAAVNLVSHAASGPDWQLKRTGRVLGSPALSGPRKGTGVRAGKSRGKKSFLFNQKQLLANPPESITEPVI